MKKQLFKKTSIFIVVMAVVMAFALYMIPVLATAQEQDCPKDTASIQAINPAPRAWVLVMQLKAMVEEALQQAERAQQVKAAPVPRRAAAKAAAKSSQILYKRIKY